MTADQPKLTRTRLALLAVLAALALCTVPRSAGAQIVTVPGDLAPGAGYRLIFVTSGVRTGASANVADYNAFVASAANAVPALAALGTTWTAIAETAAVTAQDNTGTNPLIVGGTPTNPGVPFYRLDGARVAHDNPYFWNMTSPLATITITQLGGSVPLTVRAGEVTPAAWVWTGVTPGPSKLGSSTPVAAQAVGSGAAYSWLGLAISANTNNHPLYAVSGILTAPQPAPVLPPAGRVALAVALAVLLAAAMLRRRAT